MAGAQAGTGEIAQKKTVISLVNSVCPITLSGFPIPSKDNLNHLNGSTSADRR